MHVHVEVRRIAPEVGFAEYAVGPNRRHPPLRQLLQRKLHVRIGHASYRRNANRAADVANLIMQACGANLTERRELRLTRIDVRSRCVLAKLERNAVALPKKSDSIQSELNLSRPEGQARAGNSIFEVARLRALGCK